MKYKAIPATITSVESGNLDPEPSQKGFATVETEPTPGPSGFASAGVARPEHPILVLTVETHMPEGDKSVPAMQQFALHPQDAILLCKDLIIHLALRGDKTAFELLQHLPGKRDSFKPDNESDE